MSDIVHHGVFLRPDARTCVAVTAVTGQLRAQYGLVSANAFPPHVTLAGSLSVAVPEPQLIAALAGAVRGVAPFPVVNRGVVRLYGGLSYDVHPERGGPDAPLPGLAAAVDTAIRPLLAGPAGLDPVLYRPDSWHAHLSLASHDLDEGSDLFDEVEAFVDALGVAAPASFAADTVAVYRFHHDSWTGAWWRTMRWEHVRSLRLGPDGDRR